MLEETHGREGLIRPTLAQALERYLREYGTVNRPSSARRASDTCNRFVQFVGPEVQPRSLTRDHVRMFRDARASVCSSATVASDLGRIRAFINAMRAEQPPLLDHDPTFKVPPPAPGDEEDRDARGLSDAEERVVVDALAGHQVYLDWCRLGTCAGMRPGEQSHVRGIDYDHLARVLHIKSYPGWKLKTKESRRSIQVSADAHEILARRKLSSGNPEAPLFQTRNGTPFKLDPLRRQIQRLLPEGTFFTLYALRHTFAYRCVEAKWDIGVLQKYMGHARIETTIGYTKGVDTVKLGAPPVSAAQPMSDSK